ncbi:hypothetical protein [Gryllotalpicola sp.]|uniref:hypothetical protein n=1 Tax=Gryllotalpicola sp. TaxID=1932787 RepID=UPI002613DF48|nr:hypothetical protein [Gryllotalpicola sp.]
MTPTAAEVFETAKALPREERAELTQELLRTLGTADVSDEARLAALRDAVDAAEASIEAGRFDRVPTDGLRGYIRQISQDAAEIAATKTA